MHSEILSLNFGNVMYTTETYFEHQIKSRNNLMCNSFMLKTDDISYNKHTYYISIILFCLKDGSPSRSLVFLSYKFIDELTRPFPEVLFRKEQ